MKRSWTAERGSRLANLRTEAHRYLDARWMFGKETRTETYAWLAGKMGIPKEECHIKMFDEADCERAIEIIRRNP